MAEHDHWRDLSVGEGSSAGADASPGAIGRLETALARIAAAAGRRQDALRVAELTARAAQHEADLLVQAEEQRRIDAAANAAAEAAGLEQQRMERLRETAGRLDALIHQLRTELDQQPPGG